MTTKRVPLYLQLTEKIIDQINDGTYEAGDKLPSERELCHIYDMSRITVRSALSELERDGYVKKFQGKGTFIANTTYQQNLLNVYSFTEETKKMGKTPQTNIVSFELVLADKKYASKLGIRVGDEMYRVVRCRLADQEPLIVETSYLPRYKFVHLTEKDLANSPMYDVFNRAYNIQATRAEEEFSITTLRDHEAALLAEAVGDPAMLVKRTAYDKSEEVIEYTISVINGQKYKYKVELQQ